MECFYRLAVQKGRPHQGAVRCHRRVGDGLAPPLDSGLTSDSGRGCGRGDISVSVRTRRQRHHLRTGKNIGAVQVVWRGIFVRWATIVYSPATWGRFGSDLCLVWRSLPQDFLRKWVHYSANRCHRRRLQRGSFAPFPAHRDKQHLQPL